MDRNVKRVTIEIDIENARKALVVCGVYQAKSMTDEQVKNRILDFIKAYAVKEVKEG